MNIGMILNGHYALDIRVKKEASALVMSGHKIFLLCLRNTDETYEEIIDGITIKRIDAGTNNYQLAFWDIIMSATFLHPRFKKAMNSWIEEHTIQAIHVHDLPLAGTALAFKKSLKIPVVVDFHENYPEALKGWFTWKSNPIARIKNKLFMNPDRWSAHEKTAVEKSDYVVAVVEEMKSRLIEQYNIDPDKVFVVTNTESKSFTAQELDNAVYKSLANKFIITYSGNIGAHRGLDTAIRGMANLKDHNDIVLVIIGSGSKDVITRLKTLTSELDLNDNVQFWGHQPFQKFYSFMRFTSVNVIPHISNGHTENTVPHKLFHSMMVARPVLVSTCAPLKRIVEETHSGVVFKAGDDKDFALKVLELYNNPALCEQLGKNGELATEEKYTWETTSKILSSVYSELESQLNS